MTIGLDSQSLWAQRGSCSAQVLLTKITVIFRSAWWTTCWHAGRSQGISPRQIQLLSNHGGWTVKPP